ncbi:4-hydroxy-3-methylbut-2-enyl diphosphate reductase [Methylobacterium frigidaeris]|uniref:4-hydroxy-3-methylbut-2-enyl diphosphate reductase n=1 Tax=Methylobacterium frigidaeris TaxID=2038277 RepID=A0AA37H924_9HYPH|nr:4-hydroxy-3-methylbut-2-enyl diphosphate reductase [Methylobacterium frigidaeris]PIK74120.1 4-hydroxy-3-methylbut-2-enyl diphosphate reductase [Methylobacterium frigidaeris]GJD61565.1 4-hydroxy-3-methylbut-2-enyl diphosphate reductase [Methylobacterium frigidaeris]
MAGTRENGLDLVLAQPRGFCAGVVRAVDIVERVLARGDRPVYVRHEIVHNGRVVADLKAKGARFVESLDAVPDGATTIFSAHGVSRAVEAEAARRGLPVVDATCPLVAKVHAQGRRYAAQGRTVILVGHEGHAEVEGTLGQIDGAVHLVGSVADAEALDLAADTPLAYITQTTLSVDDTKAIIATLSRRFPDLVGPETRDICYATQNRQAAVRALAEIADLILVVGARNSSNCNRLREIAAEAGRPSHLVEGAEDLDGIDLGGARTLGLTAGASTPEVVIAEVIAALQRRTPLRISTLPGIVEGVSFPLPSSLGHT